MKEEIDKETAKRNSFKYYLSEYFDCINLYYLLNKINLKSENFKKANNIEICFEYLPKSDIFTYRIINKDLGKEIYIDKADIGCFDDNTQISTLINLMKYDNDLKFIIKNHYHLIGPELNIDILKVLFEYLCRAVENNKFTKKELQYKAYTTITKHFTITYRFSLEIKMKVLKSIFNISEG